MPVRLGLVVTSAVPILLFVLLLFVVLAFGGVVLLSLALRYRAGTARRRGRRWIATMNVWMTTFSALLYLFVVFLMSFWLGPTLRFAFAGMAIGAILGVLGLALTRWEVEREELFYTPSRWLALIITFAITARLAYGWWHATHSRYSPPGGQHWFMSATATQLSMAVAAGLIGYYLVYAIGVRLRLHRQQQSR
jgi:membrane protein CcdC involved in cytochrome C biogenesis